MGRAVGAARSPRASPGTPRRRTDQGVRRIDHLVGFYRTFVIPADGSGRYSSPDLELIVGSSSNLVLPPIQAPHG